MEALLSLLKEKQYTISTCESFTGGLFCSRLSQVPGASSVLKGGIVTYATSIKISVAGVDASVIDTYGVISKECAIEMAVKAKQLFDTDICVSFTGNAGPGQMEDKAAGEVYCAIAFHNQVYGFGYHIKKERNEVREEAVLLMVEEIRKLLTHKKKG